MSNERLEVLGGLPLFEPLSPDERERLAAVKSLIQEHPFSRLAA